MDCAILGIVESSAVDRAILGSSCGKIALHFSVAGDDIVMGAKAGALAPLTLQHASVPRWE